MPSDRPAFPCVHARFAVQAAETPQAVAVVYGGQSLTYRELDARSNQLARYLQERGVGPETVVGVHAAGLELILIMLGTLKAGGAYMPLDPLSPVDRLEWMLAETRAPMVLSQERLAGSVPSSSHRKLYFVDSLWPEIGSASEEAVVADVSQDSLAYVIYTSGSTGHPKGVAIPHAGVSRLVLNTNYVSLGTADVVAQASNVAFDAATFEIWGALLNGARLAGISRETLLSAVQLERELDRLQISTLFLTTAIFNQIAPQRPGAFHSVKNLIIGGEVCDPYAVAKVLKSGAPQRLINCYGPTETTTFATFHLIENVAECEQAISIGRPISNTEIHVMDAQMNPVAAGEPGEIYIGGPGLAHGYVHQEEITRERFVPHPFRPGARLFRSGDLARYLPNGNLEFLGRIDHQVKLRGFRIELGSIERNIAAHPSIVQSFALMSERAGDKRLIAYIVATQPAPSETEVRAFLKERLPEYMIPSMFLFIDALPITPQGKVDVDALAALEEKATMTRMTDGKFLPPQTPIEIALAGIFEEVLGFAPVGSVDNFFDLGGHSLMAARLFAKIRERLGKSPPLGTLLQAPTVRSLAVELMRDNSVPTLITIQPGGPKQPLFLVHGGDGGVFIFGRMAAYLGTNRPVYGIEAPWLAGDCTHIFSTKELAGRYIAQLQAVQPEGPYLIGGYSLGGLIVYEMAQQLAERGHKVSSLILFDTFNARGAHRLTLAGHLAATWRILAGKNWMEAIRFLVDRMNHRVKKKFFGRVAGIKLVGAQLSRKLSPEDLDLARTAALLAYDPKRYEGSVSHFICEEQEKEFGFVHDDSYGWQGEAVPGLTVHRVPGNHGTMFEEPNVPVLARLLGSYLEDKP